MAGVRAMSFRSATSWWRWCHTHRAPQRPASARACIRSIAGSKIGKTNCRRQRPYSSRGSFQPVGYRS